MGYTDCVEVEDKTRAFTPLDKWVLNYVAVSKTFTIEDDLKYLSVEYKHYVINEAHNWPLRNHISDLLEHVSKLYKGK